MSYAVTVTVSDDATAAVLVDCKVWICSDEAGTTLLFTEYTGTAGTCVFNLDNGTYYGFARKTGYTFDNPATITVSGAVLSVSIEGTAEALTLSTETEICNNALAMLGSGVDQPYLDDYGTDTSQTAVWCRKLLDATRREVLGSWAFVETITYLLGTSGGADDASVSHPDWLYAYPLPTNPACLRFLGLVANNGAVTGERTVLLDWERYQSFVLTDYITSEFYWWYIRDEEDFSALAEPTRTAISYLLASKLAAPVLRGPEAYARRRELLQEYVQFARKNAVIFNQRQVLNPAPHGAIRTIDIS